MEKHDRGRGDMGWGDLTRHVHLIGRGGSGKNHAVDVAGKVEAQSLRRRVCAAPPQIKTLYFVSDNPRASPLLVSTILRIPRSSAESYLLLLHELRLIRRIVRGLYEATDFGRRFLKKYEALHG